MVKKLFEQIIKGIDVRQNLSKLRVEIKDEYERANVEDLIERENLPQILALLQNEDAKTRKNAALFMGDMELDGLFLNPLYEAYQAETQLFVKSAYLTAIAKMEYDALLPELKERLAELEAMELTVENQKHLQEEMKLLSSMIVEKEGFHMHRFIGEREESEVILLTNRLYQETVLEELKEQPNLDTSKAKIFSAGIQMKTNRLDDILPIRTYQELLFMIPGMKTVEMDAKLAGSKVAASELVTFLEKRHKGSAPFYFRIEMKTKMPLDKKAKFAKVMAGEIEKNTERKLINTTNHYEVELRLIETKEGKFNVLVKLLTITFDRFFYRKEMVAASIKPVNAALLVRLAKPYMIEDAQVLDPFCGVGTMLIERQMQVKAHSSYGVDMYNEAIRKAQINMKAAGQIIHFVNRDFFAFTHDYAFDEIFTNMPFATGHKSEEEIATIYERFFGKAREHLTAKGRIIMYTHNREYIPKLAAKYRFAILEKFTILEREGTDLFILEVRN